MKLEEILGLVNVALYLVHITVFSVLCYRQNKKAGLKSTFLILVFLSVIFFVSLQIGGLVAQVFTLILNDERTISRKAIHDTATLLIATFIETPIWFIFLRKGKQS